MREGIIAVAVAAVGKPDICPLVFQGRFCIDVDDAAHRVTTVERPLRTAQHFDPVHLVLFRIVQPVVHPERQTVPDRRRNHRYILRHETIILPPDTALPRLYGKRGRDRKRYGEDPQCRTERSGRAVVQATARPPAGTPVGIGRDGDGDPKPEHHGDQRVQFLYLEPLYAV